mmetsp:Transcript_4226/g.12703  ORF Transcript_4226/g.12703 Transcript_4226/m.12703 type:complete len:98 (+) Transcript_4226:789-1082(+)
METSVVLVLREDLVRKEAAKNFRSTAAEFEILPYGDDVMFGWKTEDLNVSGALGDATKATAAVGEALLESVEMRLRQVLKFAVDFDLTSFERQPCVN